MDEAAIEAEVERRLQERIAQQQDLHPEKKAELNAGLDQLRRAALDESAARVSVGTFRRSQAYSSLPSTRLAAALVVEDMGIETED